MISSELTKSMPIVAELDRVFLQELHDCGIEDEFSSVPNFT